MGDRVRSHGASLRFLRILTLTADAPPAQWSGIGTAVLHQVQALRALGVEVELLTRERLQGTQFPIAVRGGDLVHLHSLALAELALELTRRHELPLVYTAHSSIERELGTRAPQWAAVQQRVFSGARLILFVSRDERDAAIARMPEIASRAHVLHNRVPAPPPPGDYDANGPIVFAGRFTATKGFDLVLEIAETLAHELVLAGGHGDRELHERAETLARAHPRCRLAGWLAQPELERLFASASLVLMPSRYEPFGMVALEAMRAGAPLLASDVGGLREIVQPQSGGRLVAELNAFAWREACAQLLADVGERRAMHARGPEFVARHFDVRNHAAALLPLLHTAVACKRWPI